MKPGLRIGLIVLVAFVANGTLANAQDLEIGTWIGKLRLPDGSAQRILLVVEEIENDSQQLTLFSGDSAYPCDDVKLKDRQLLFSWAPGDEPVLCFLQRQNDQSFEGSCTPPGDVSGVGIVLVPPTEAKEGDGSSDNDDEGTSEPLE